MTENLWPKSVTFTAAAWMIVGMGNHREQRTRLNSVCVCRYRRDAYKSLLSNYRQHQKVLENKLKQTDEKERSGHARPTVHRFDGMIVTLTFDL